MTLYKKKLKNVNKRFNYVKRHFSNRKQITNYIKMNNNNVKEENKRNESDRCYISIVSSINDVEVLSF